jgi:hypothetical protein
MHSPTHIKYCHPLPEAYTSLVVKLGWLKRTLALLATAVTVAGCSGINATQSISPLMFFLPGLGQTKPVEKSADCPSTVACPCLDNQTVHTVQTASLTHTRVNMDSVQLN